MVESSAISILYVGSEPDATNTAADTLESEDTQFIITTATSTDGGLRRLVDDDIDCIVSAYDLPGRDGIEFLEAVRADAPDLPFILFTANGSESVASEAISAGVTDYIQKEDGTDQYSVLADRIRTAVEQYQDSDSNAHLGAVVETARDGISILGENGEFIYVNQAYADLYGYDTEALIGEHWELLSPSGEAADARNEILSTVAEEGYWSGETTGLRADGSTFIEDHNIAQIESGELICAVRNHTADQEQQAEFTRLQTLVKTINDPVYILDETGQFEYVNDALAEMVGYDRETIIGETPALIKSDAAIEQGETHLGRLLSSDGPESVQFEIEIQPHDGEPIPCEDHMGLLPYTGESFEGSVGILRDITERKERERNLQRRNQRLNKFASIVSHDLRTPLSVAFGGITIAQEECDSEQLERAERALNRMDALIEDLLELARGDETVNEVSPVNLGETANQWWQNVDTADATLVNEVESTIYADEKRLNRLGENLVRNAIEHGGDDVTVTFGDLEGGFYVEDDGAGIPEDEYDDVFTAGYTTSDQGTGFGLSIVEQIVTSHDWEIRVTSGTAGGARFEITGVAFAE